MLFCFFTCDQFSLQLFNNSLQCQRALCSRLLQAVFHLLPLDDLDLKLLGSSFALRALVSQFGLQLCIDSISSIPGLLQLLFSTLALGKLSQQLLNDTLQFRRTLRSCLLQIAFHLLPFCIFSP